VVTDGLTPEAVAELAVAAARFSRTGPRRASRVGVGALVHARPLRVAVVTGTSGVGKSSAVWSAFMRLRESGNPVGFIDLRQLGMVGLEGGAVDHGLQARNARAIATVFHDRGAEVVLINGHIDNDESLAQYRSEFSDSEVSYLRLTADEASLTERFLLRAVGSGPELAGDTLRGVSEETAVRLAAVAACEQAASDLAQAVDLDTTAMTVEEAGHRLLEALSPPA
jgi:hypothetical protein